MKNQHDYEYWFGSSHKPKEVIFPNRAGEANSNAKITKEVAMGIKAMLSGGTSQAEVIRHFKVTRSIVNNIKRGLAWADLEEIHG